MLYMESNLILIIVQVLISAVLYFLLKNFIPTYINEKGKNLATKQDIEVITEKIKTVESKINIKTTSQIDYNSVKRKMILEFFGAFNHLETTLFRHYSDSDNEAKNLGFIEKMNDAKFNYNVKQGEVELFIGGMEFLTIVKDINKVLLELSHTVEMHYNEALFIIKSEDDPQTRYEKVRESKREFHSKKIEILSRFIPLRAMLMMFLQNELQKSFS